MRMNRRLETSFALATGVVCLCGLYTAARAQTSAGYGESQAAAGKVTGQGAASVRTGFRPVVDGKILPSHPFDPVATSVSADVPVIVGYTRTERTVYNIDDPKSSQVDEKSLLQSTKRTLSDSAEKVIEDYKKKHATK